MDEDDDGHGNVNDDNDDDDGHDLSTKESGIHLVSLGR